MQDLATVDQKYLAGDKVTFIRGEKKYRRSYIFGLHYLFDTLLLNVLFGELFWDHSLSGFGPDHARSYGVNVDTKFPQLPGQPSGQGNNAALGSSIVKKEGQSG